MGVQLPEEVLEFLARRIHSSVSVLQGALNRVSFHVSNHAGELTVEAVKSLLRNILQKERRRTLNIEGIQKLVAKHFDVRFVDLMDQRRSGDAAFPREIAMYLSHRVTRRSLKTTREAFGGCDQDTVLHACRLVKDRMKADVNVRHVDRYLNKRLNR